DIRTVESPDGAADDIRDAILELREDQRLLGPADLLHQVLLGELGGNATETGRRHLNFNLLTELRIRLDAASIKDGNLVVLGENLIGDHEFGESADVAGLGFDGDAEFAGGADGLFGGGEQGL